MAEEAAIQIAYNRRMLRNLVALHTVLCALLPVMIIFLGGGAIYLFQTKSGPNCFLSFLGLLEVGILAIGTPYLFRHLSVLRRSRQRSEPAITINKIGIMDYASGYMVGQIAWNEIQKMHLSTREVRFLSNRFFKTPIVAKHRFFVIVLKDKRYLEVTADELIRRLNQVYIAEVRGAV